MTRDMRARCLVASVLCGMMLCLCCVAADFTICKKCGYEMPSQLVACTHCNAPLPATTSAQGGAGAASGTPSQQSGTVIKGATLSAKDVEDEIKLGTTYLTKKRRDLAGLFFRNAAALNLLVQEEAAPKNTALTRASRIQKLITRASRGATAVQRKCRVCAGTGQRTLSASDMQGKQLQMNVGGMKCKKCKGEGVVLGRGTVDEQKLSYGRAKSMYMTVQQSRRRVPIGGAWIPTEIEALLTVRQIAALKRAIPSLCATCVGLGRETCRKCTSSGWTKCRGTGCKGGQVKTTVKGTLVKGTMNKTVKCKVCSGHSKVPCLTCRGSGAVLCRKCVGAGMKSLCTRCGGQGTSPCTKCKGSGQHGDGTCASCRGERVMLCRTCMGEGRK